MVISLNLKLLANLCGTEYFEIQIGFKKKEVHMKTFNGYEKIKDSGNGTLCAGKCGHERGSASTFEHQR